MPTPTTPILLDQNTNVQDLVSRVPRKNWDAHQACRFVYQEAAFYNRVFFVIRTKGKTPAGPNPPELLGTVRVIGFQSDHETGSHMTLVDDSSKKVLEVGHVPTRLFEFPVFVSVPICQAVKWEAAVLADETVVRRLIWGVCIKQSSNLKFYNRGALAVVTPNEYKKHFGTSPRH